MDLEAIRNDNNDYSAFTVRKGVALNIEGAKLWFTMRDADGEVFYQANSEDNPNVVVITNAVQGKFMISLAPEVTAALERETAFLYDVQAEFTDNKVKTLQEGKLTVKMDVTYE